MWSGLSSMKAASGRQGRVEVVVRSTPGRGSGGVLLLDLREETVTTVLARRLAARDPAARDLERERAALLLLLGPALALGHFLYLPKHRARLTGPLARRMRVTQTPCTPSSCRSCATSRPGPAWRACPRSARCRWTVGQAVDSGNLALPVAAGVVALRTPQRRALPEGLSRCRATFALLLNLVSSTPWASCARRPSVPHVVHHALHEAHRPRGRARGAAGGGGRRAPAYVLPCAARAGPTRLGAVLRCCLAAIALGAVLLV